MAEDVFGIVGREIAGAYRVAAVVAEGGFGVVYRAYHAGFRADVALKCLKIPDRFDAAKQESFLEQFRAEAELLFRLSASIPTVVRPLHVDAMRLEDGRFVPFMALEWLEGENLDAVIRHRIATGAGGIPLKKLVRTLTPVARALERAHTFPGPNGPICIVHRDVKPENIFLARVADEEVVKILDFGIGKAKSVASQVAGKTSTNDGSAIPAAFTPCYGAPEQWLPRRYGQTGPWTDVWGLALTMVEALTLRTALEGDIAAMMGTALDPARRPTPRSEGVEVSDEVDAVFRRALAVDPRERFANAGVFWDALAEASGVAGEAPRGRRHDQRAEGGATSSVEHIEAAMPRSARRAAATPARIPTLLPSIPEVSLPVKDVAAPVASGRKPDSGGGPARERPRASVPALGDPAAKAPVEIASLPPERKPSVPRQSLPLPPAPLLGDPLGARSHTHALEADDLHDDAPLQLVDETPGHAPALGGERGRPRRPEAAREPAPRAMGRRARRAASDPPPVRVWPLIKVPLVLIGVGALVGVGAQAYAVAAGEGLALGWVRPQHFAGILLAAGVGLLVWRIASLGARPGRR